ncbi:MAG: enoyl-CoA hydratase/isomerase family protein [Alphaproteobacteria bacterium]
MAERTYKSMIVKTEGKLARVTLNRPEALNAMPRDMVLEMDAIAEELERDRNVRVIAFTGAGRAFSAGIDLKALASGDIREDYLEPWERFLHRLETMDKLVLCLLHGYFIGGGLQLALACDIRVATPSAKCGLPAVKEGLIPSMGPWRLARHVGLGRAKQLCLLGNLIDGAEAHKIGLVDHLVPEDRAEAEFERLLGDYLACAGEAGRATKRYLNASYDLGFDESFALYMELQRQVFAGADFAEAKAAFTAKRTPVWR